MRNNQQFVTGGLNNASMDITGGLPALTTLYGHQVVLIVGSTITHTQGLHGRMTRIVSDMQPDLANVSS